MRTFYKRGYGPGDGSSAIDNSHNEFAALWQDAIDDHMTSENHHPGFVLIPTTTFEAAKAAIKETIR